VTVDLQINNSASPQARYLTWAPSPCRIRLTDPSGASTPLVNVTLTGRSSATGGAITFRKTATGTSSTSLSLQLPIDGASVPFFILGRFGQPSVSDQDVSIEIRAETTLIDQVRVMVRIRKNANTLTPGAPLALSGPLNGLAVSPSQPVIYVTSTSGKLYKISETTGLLIDSVSVGGTAQEVVLSSDGTQLYIAIESGALQIRATSDLSLVTTISAAGGAFGAALSPDGTKLWVARPGTSQVLVIDVATKAVIRTIDGGAPRRITFSPDGLTAIIGNEAGYVTFVR